jgi:hypothetical protein
MSPPPEKLPTGRTGSCGESGLLWETWWLMAAFSPAWNWPPHNRPLAKTYGIMWGYRSLQIKSSRSRRCIANNVPPPYPKWYFSSLDKYQYLLLRKIFCFKFWPFCVYFTLLTSVSLCLPFLSYAPLPFSLPLSHFFPSNDIGRYFSLPLPGGGTGKGNISRCKYPCTVVFLRSLEGNALVCYSALL